MPGALELRRVGIDRNSQAMADADATELQGNGESLGGRRKRERERRRKNCKLRALATSRRHLFRVSREREVEEVGGSGSGRKTSPEKVSTAKNKDFL